MIAFGSQHTYNEIDNFSVLLKFKSGLHGTFCSSAEASWLFPFERMEVFCDHRTILTQEMENLTDSHLGDSNSRPGLSSAETSWLFPFERMEVFCDHRTILTQEMENLTDSHLGD